VIRAASQAALAVFPQHLRPAQYNATRLSYLDHMGDHDDDGQVWTRAKPSGAVALGSRGGEARAARPLFLGGSSGATPRDAALAGSQLPKVKGPMLPLVLSS
jgi:hypothetical protein